MQHAKLGIDWESMLARGAEIVESYDTPVTLRQLFYHLVMDEGLPNRQQQYKYLSASTAKLRREGEFPELADMTRTIHRRVSWSNPTEALAYIANNYERDHAEGQHTLLYLAVEKATLVEQVRSWFDQLSIPVLALQGYSSESYEGAVARDLAANPMAAR